MAVVSNVNRKASAEAVVQHVALLKRIVGLSIQTHRAYESPGRGGKRIKQKDVAATAQTGQPVVSRLENGKEIPGDPALSGILGAAGFSLGPNGGGTALLALLQTLRDHEENLKKIVSEKPA